ncbi:Protein of unknown function [Cotesia congregata]|uniref:Uncharacterized protein n=1 Tax=Cotesia congregata TaxID=51543 RepID=A0A8J2MY71_COTCN|nr:Protein of unknown function [Cotesia congregata]
MKYSYKIDSIKALKEISQMTKEALTNTLNKVEIFPHTGCYLNEASLRALQISNVNNWRGLINGLFVQIYGNHLKYMSVKGSRGNISIDKKIMMGIYKLAKSIDTNLQWETFQDCVGKLCSNKRRKGTQKEEKNKKINQIIIDTATTITEPIVHNPEVSHPPQLLPPKKRKIQNQRSEQYHQNKMVSG